MKKSGIENNENRESSWIQSTSVLAILIKKRLLRKRLQRLSLLEDNLLDLLNRLYREVAIPVSMIQHDYPLDKLQETGLIAIVNLSKPFLEEQKAAIKKKQLSLIFVRGLNFELTYRCNKACLHCLQKMLRVSFYDKELNVDTVKNAIYEAWFSGLIEEKPPSLDRGINFTGGEVLYKYGKIFELIKYASSLNLGVRLNTNNWWDDKKLFVAGGKRFISADHLVQYLKDIGLTVIAFSFDERFEYERTAFARLVNSVKACEKNKLHYEIICTGRTKAQIEELYSKLRSKLKRKLYYRNTVPMEMIDMGGAADGCRKGEVSRDNLQNLAGNVGCEQKDFYLPIFLHINPRGGVRSCLYGISLGNMGNLSNNSLIEIINNYPSDAVSLAYKEKKLSYYSEKYFTPYASIYKSFKHPCTANVILARLIEETSLFEQENGRIPEENELRKINRRIAEELNLAREQ